MPFSVLDCAEKQYFYELCDGITRPAGREYMARFPNLFI